MNLSFLRLLVSGGRCLPTRSQTGSTASPTGRTDPVVTTDDPDADVRLAAFDRLHQLQTTHGTTLPWAAIDGGFNAGGQHYHLASQAEGIFKPARMRTLSSIKTVVPRVPGLYEAIYPVFVAAWHPDALVADIALAGCGKRLV